MQARWLIAIVMSTRVEEMGVASGESQRLAAQIVLALIKGRCVSGNCFFLSHLFV